MGHRRKIKLIELSLIVVACFFGFVGCNPKPVEEVEKVEEPRYIDTPVGTVTSVEESSNIVLFRAYSRVDPNSKSVFLTKGIRGVSVLNLTGQANKFFVAAEKASGQLEVGDAVFQRDLNPKFKSKPGSETPVISDQIGPQDNIMVPNAPSQPQSQNPFTEILPGG